MRPGRHRLTWSLGLGCGSVVAISSAVAAHRVHGLQVQVCAAAASLVFWVDDVDATFESLVRRVAPAHATPHDTGKDNRKAVVRDPDGTLVELVAKRV